MFINLDPNSSWGELNIKLYKICDYKDIEPEWRDKSCPSINMEHFFIAMIIICFLMSLLTFTVEIFVHVQDYPFRFLVSWLEQSFHNLISDRKILMYFHFLLQKGHGISWSIIHFACCVGINVYPVSNPNLQFL